MNTALEISGEKTFLEANQYKFMKRLVFVVEGNTEVNFVNNKIIPYLIELGHKNPMTVQTIITNRKQHKKGGVINYEYFKNDINRVLAQGNVIVTSLIDFYKLPNNFPNYSKDSNYIDAIEKAIVEDINNEFLIPYIQKYELESLMFSDSNAFKIVIDSPKQMDEINEIIESFVCPEDINSNPEKAPSKRLNKIFNYDKISDSYLIFDSMKIEVIIDKCPRFNLWIKKIIEKLND
jgi:hypothetical protein